MSERRRRMMAELSDIRREASALADRLAEYRREHVDDFSDDEHVDLSCVWGDMDDAQQGLRDFLEEE